MKRPKLLLLIALVLISLPCGLWEGGALSTGKVLCFNGTKKNTKALKKSVVIGLVLLVSMSTIMGAVSAVYTPESQIVFQITPGPFTHSSVLGAKLGTFVITSTTGEIYSPSLVHIGDASSHIPVTGLMRNWETGDYVLDSNAFQIICVSYPNGLGAEPVLRVLWNDVEPIVDNQCTIYQTTFHVELYLVNTLNTNRHAESGYRPASFFKPNSPYSLPSNFNPVFSLGVAESPNINVGWYTSGSTIDPDAGLGEYVVTNGQQGPESTPIIGPGAYTDPNNPGSPGFNYGDPPQVLNFLFSFLYNTVNFDLSDAYVGKPNLYLNTAQMDVQNGVAGTTYKQKITFTDIWGGPTFQLKPDADSDGIDFSLVFGSKPVDYGVADNWENMVPGPNNTKDLYIRGIDSSQVNQCVSGEYCDTIIVNITAADN